MYRTLIRRRVVSNFERLSAGDYKRVVGQLAPDVHHVFAGAGPLDSQRVAIACEHMAAYGIEEAAAAPIVG